LEIIAYIKKNIIKIFIKRNSMKLSFHSYKLFIIASFILFLFSCSDSSDQRAQTLKYLGQPDDIVSQQSYSYKVEYWIYARSDINTVYEFEKSASGCGGSGEWYLARRYYADYHFGYTLWDPPPTITHTPITKAPTGKTIEITAEIKVNKKAIKDTAVKRADLNYRSVGDSLFATMVMSMEDSVSGKFSGEIPFDVVTEKGVEYFLMATSDSAMVHWSTLPENGYFVIAVSDSFTQVEKAGKTTSNFRENKVQHIIEPANKTGRNLPLGP
jgi:hypothetical protein